MKTVIHYNPTERPKEPERHLSVSEEDGDLIIRMVDKDGTPVNAPRLLTITARGYVSLASFANKEVAKEYGIQLGSNGQILLS